MRMDETRWPRIALREMQNGAVGSKWWKETTRYIEEFEIEEQDLMLQSAQRESKAQIWKKENLEYEIRQFPEHCAG